MTRTHAHERTCNLASVELETKGDAVLPGLWSDPNEPGQDRLRDTVENHFGRICVSVENLDSKGKQRTSKKGLVTIRRRCAVT